MFFQDDIKTLFISKLFNTFVIPMFLKRAAIYILLSTFLFNISGYFIAFKVLQYQVRKEIKSEIKQQLSRSDLTTIAIKKAKKNAILWEEENKEFYYGGALYDIVKSCETNDSIFYYCINDKQEEILFDNLEEHIDRYVTTDEFSKNLAAKKLISPNIKLYFNNSVSLACDYCYLETIFFTKQTTYTSAVIEINSPPPEFV